jgi:hypothetical protein
MNTPATATEALRQCELLWEELARTGSHNKQVVAQRILGYEPELGCPACEYDTAAEGGCFNCPVDAWRRRNSEDFVAACTNSGSPYDDWVSTGSPDSRKSAAFRVLDLIRSSEAYLSESPNVS